MSNTEQTELYSKSRIGVPQALRPHEVRDGGFIVIERLRKKRLLRPAAWPVEVSTMQEALNAVEKLRRRWPDRCFAVFHQAVMFEAESDDSQS